MQNNLPPPSQEEESDRDQYDNMVKSTRSAFGNLLRDPTKVGGRRMSRRRKQRVRRSRRASSRSRRGGAIGSPIGTRRGGAIARK